MATDSLKRPYEGLGSAVVPAAKRPRQDVALMQRPHGGALIPTGPPRTSALMAPVMLLTGHEADIFAAKFSPTGDVVASAGFDRLIYLWNVYGECENFAILKGHAGPIMDLSFTTDGATLASASTDKSVALWDVETGTRIKRFRGHTSYVNSCSANRRGPQQFVTSSDDGMIKLWDARQRRPTQTFSNIYQVMAVCFNDTSDQVFSGGLDNEIKVWDLRRNDLHYKLPGHTETVTGLRLSPDGAFLLSNSMDNTVRMWDVRPYAASQRQLKLFMGSQHNFEKNLLRCAWSSDGKKVAAGSADRFLYVWDTATCRILYKLPGHDGSVNDVDFHPKEPIVVSGGSDKKLYLGEIQ